MSVYDSFLPWLEKDQKSKIKDLIDKTIIKELKCRNWGDAANGTSSGGHQKIIIYDYKGLLLASGVLRYILNKFDTNLYYRGQRIDWPLVPSLFRFTKTKTEREENLKWLRKVMKEITKEKFDFNGTNLEREALCQHYGLQTRWLDVIDNIHSALWFSCYETASVADTIIKQPERNHNIGYIYLIASPQNKINNYVIVNDLRKKPSQWLRPHIQQAYVMKLKDELSYSSKFDHLTVMTLCVPIDLARRWSNIETITEHDMFPNESLDDGYRFWNRAKDKVEKKFPMKPPY